MKRPLFYGIALSLFISAVAMLFGSQIAQESPIKYVLMWIGALCGFGTGFVVWAGRKAPSTKTWWPAALFWIVGFLASGLLFELVFYFGDISLKPSWISK